MVPSGSDGARPGQSVGRRRRIERQLPAEHGERAEVAGEPVLAQHVAEAEAPVELPGPARGLVAVLGRGQQHPGPVGAGEQGPQQALAEAAALGVRADVQLGELEVALQPQLLVRAGVAQPAPDLLEPPLPGSAGVAVGDADQHVRRVQPADRGPARAAHVVEPERAALPGGARRVAHGAHVDVQGLGQPPGQLVGARA